MEIRKAVMVVLLMIGLAASSYVVGQRARVESRNRAVEIVVDYGEVEQMAAAAGRMTSDVLRELKRAGATSVAIGEQTLKDLIDARVVVPYGTHQFAVQQHLKQRVLARLQMALGDGRGDVKCTTLSGDRYCYLAVPETVAVPYLQSLPVGLPEEAIQAAREAGMEVVARLVNYPGATPEAIRSVLGNLRILGINKLIFQGDQVLGFRGAVEYTAEALEGNGLCFGRIEFARQKGEVSLSERIPGNLLIVHSISQNEMPGLGVGTIVERFQKAVRERGVRLCYVRMYYTSDDDLVAANAGYISAIANGIARAGYVPTRSHPYEDVNAPLAARIAVGAGVAAGAVLLLLTVASLSVRAFVLWMIAALAVCAGLSGAGEMGRKAVALLAAAVFPTLAALNAVRPAPESPTAAAGLIGRTIARFAFAVATASAGGLLVAGLLSERIFMLRIDQFMGVKLAHLLPILALSVLFVGGVAWKSDTWANQKRRFRDRLRDTAANPVLIWQAAGMALLLGILGVMVARSGNEPGVGVSGFELKFRAILDKVMLVRPRTKEFLVGYPALLAGIAFALRGRRQWAAPLVVLGTIGLISALNTFCHIHTPILVSALRVVNGAVLGGLIGLLAYRVVRDWPGRERK